MSIRYGIYLSRGLDMSIRATHSGCWCKICGVTSADEAASIADLGADSIGLNFYSQSPRYLLKKDAAEIAASVKNCSIIALFVNPSVEEVESIISEIEIDGLQFHGDEDSEFCESFGVDYIKAISMKENYSPKELEEYHPNAWALLLDSYVKGLPGGTGEIFDWNNWPVANDRKLILAGGLTPENVASGIKATMPYGVDVSSGVEGEIKGSKDISLVKEFIKEVRLA